MKWNLHQEFSSLILKNLFLDKTATNVTLVADNNKTIDAHRFVLTYASSFFRDIFVNNPEKHLTLHLQGLKYETLVNLVKYIYIGEVLVRNECWQDFMMNATKWNLVKLIETQDKVKEDNLNFPESNMAQEKSGEGLLSESSDEKGPDNGLLADVKQEITTDTVNEIVFQEDIKQEVFAIPLNVNQLDTIEPKHSQQKRITEITKETIEPTLSQKKKIQFMCDLCDKDSASYFLLITDLMKHKKEHASGLVTRPIQEVKVKESIKPSPRRWSSDKSYNLHPCDQCDYTCSRPIRLRQPKKTRHGLAD